MSISDQITRLQNAKAAIKQSIENKGVTVGEDVKLDKYADYIDSIEIGSGDSGGGSGDSEYTWPDFYELRTRQLSASKGPNIFALFAQMYVKESEARYKNLIENLDTTGATDISYMFYNFNYGISDTIKELDLTGYDISKVSNFTYMFNYCKLDYLNISGWDFSSYSSGVNHRMFNRSLIKEINMSNCNFSNVKDLYVFAGSSTELVTINMTGCDTSKVTRVQSMFSDCNKLTTIIGEIDASSLSNGFYGDTSNNPFDACYALETVYIKNIYKNVTTMNNNAKWGICLKETVVKDECLVYIINELPDLYDKGLTATDKIVLTLPPTNTLTQEQVQVAIDKGWQVANTTY